MIKMNNLGKKPYYKEFRKQRARRKAKASRGRNNRRLEQLLIKDNAKTKEQKPAPAIKPSNFSKTERFQQQLNTDLV